MNTVQVFVLNGALLSMDILAFLLADEGDSFLVPTPAYNGYFAAGVQRWGVQMVGVPLTEKVRKSFIRRIKGRVSGPFVFE